MKLAKILHYQFTEKMVQKTFILTSFQIVLFSFFNWNLNSKLDEDVSSSVDADDEGKQRSTWRQSYKRYFVLKVNQLVLNSTIVHYYYLVIKL